MGMLFYTDNVSLVCDSSNTAVIARATAFTGWGLLTNTMKTKVLITGKHATAWAPNCIMVASFRALADCFSVQVFWQYAEYENSMDAEIAHRDANTKIDLFWERLVSVLIVMSE